MHGMETPKTHGIGGTNGLAIGAGGKLRRANDRRLVGGRARLSLRRNGHDQNRIGSRLGT
jgi:hypothetical protein